MHNTLSASDHFGMFYIKGLTRLHGIIKYFGNDGMLPNIKAYSMFLYSMYSQNSNIWGS